MLQDRNTINHQSYPLPFLCHFQLVVLVVAEIVNQASTPPMGPTSSWEELPERIGNLEGPKTGDQVAARFGMVSKHNPRRFSFHRRLRALESDLGTNEAIPEPLVADRESVSTRQARLLVPHAAIRNIPVAGNRSPLRDRNPLWLCLADHSSAPANRHPLPMP